VDRQNSSVVWRLPIAIVAGIVGSILAFRNADSFSGAIGGLFFFCMLVGGLGLVTFIILGFFLESVTPDSSNVSEVNAEKEYLPVFVTQEDEQEMEQDVIDHILNVAKRIEEIGISFYGCYGLERKPESFQSLVNVITSEIPPSGFNDLVQWETVVHITAIHKYLNAFQEATNPLKLDRMLKIFPIVPDESIEDYTSRCLEVTGMISATLNQEANE